MQNPTKKCDFTQVSGYCREKGVTEDGAVSVFREYQEMNGYHRFARIDCSCRKWITNEETAVKKTGNVHDTGDLQIMLRVPLQKEAKIHTAPPPFFRTVRSSLAGFHVMRDGIIIKDIWLFSGIAEGGCLSTKKIDKCPRGSGLMTLA